MFETGTASSANARRVIQDLGQGRHNRVAQIVRMFWRRRLALLLPFLIMIPISFAATMLLPQKYVARALILMQEADPQNPLVSRTAVVAERIPDRIAGMRALLRSDNVLSDVVKELDGNPQMPVIQRNLRIQEYRQALELDNVGNNLLEFRLSGSRREGLGGELAVVIKHFLETYSTASPYRTPERIVEIDRPEDPTRPVRSRLVTLIIGLASGLAMGVALALLLEFIDANLYDSREIEEAAGVPVIATMPHVATPPDRA